MDQPPAPELPAELPPVKRSNRHVISLVVIIGLAGFCIVALLLGAAVLFPVFSQARLGAQTTACMSNLRKMAKGHLMYAADWDGLLPSAANWQAATMPYVGNESAFHCPTLKLKDPAGFGYAFNRSLEKREVSKIASPGQMVLLFETAETGKNAAAGKEAVPLPGRHRVSGSYGSTVGYLNGQAKWIVDRDPTGVWEPGAQR